MLALIYDSLDNIVIVEFYKIWIFQPITMRLSIELENFQILKSKGLVKISKYQNICINIFIVS